VELVPHWDQELTATEFKVAFAPWGTFFLYAKVQFQRGNPDEPQDAYVNVWAGKELNSEGTLYCSLACTPNCQNRCLCGSCLAESGSGCSRAGYPVSCHVDPRHKNTQAKADAEAKADDAEAKADDAEAKADDDAKAYAFGAAPTMADDG